MSVPANARWALLGALWLAGCPSGAPGEPANAPGPVVASAGPAASPPRASAALDPEPEKQAGDGGAVAAEDAGAPPRRITLRSDQLDSMHIACDAVDEIGVANYPAHVPDCDSEVRCALDAPASARLSGPALATGGDPAVCQHALDPARGEYEWRPLPDLTRRVRKICPNACCGVAVRGCL